MMDDFKDDKTQSPSAEVFSRSVDSPNETAQSIAEPVTYRLYKRRFIGLVALVVLNIVGGFSAVWFGSIAGNTADEFGFTLGQVNWLSNVLNLTYIPASIASAFICKRWGVRMTCYVGSVFLIVSAWVRYAGTSHSISTNASLCLLMLGQLLAGIAQPTFQSRTTVTMIIGVANPFGTGIAQIISPVVGSVRTSILSCRFHKKPSFISLIRAVFGREPKTKRTFMSVRERIDFVIITLIFGHFHLCLLSIDVIDMSTQEPYGYSSDTAGFSVQRSSRRTGHGRHNVADFRPVLTRHLALTCKVFCPILGILWLCMIWAGLMYAIMAIIGGFSIPILPAALELAVEVTRNADGSSAIYGLRTGNLVTVIFVLSENALRAGAGANPPFNMHRAIIFQGAFALATSMTVFALQGKQSRRELDEQRMQETKQDVRMVEQATP
ncbi:major facilitator superfamily domain-containing protein [Irpex lacteus]|nr:major facilitator superfamily domain-containing protein [Irpex lacteus]